MAPKVRMFFLLCAVVKSALVSAGRSAVVVERVFSGGRDTISLRRASLKPETIRTRLMLLKHHLRLKRKSFQDAIRTLDVDQSMEEVIDLDAAEDDEVGEDDP
ncbi:hypothetical protein GGX14DRAFT_577507 [Mycena pura]|uniref:HAT C-terminal dimerisation domain-containing protein n=1 Tax=Mycena pura TaxID=153505 RepID=A0AAD6Y652_9AGAR|nr:hypothetical protein GGX14DRAFT_577507 [Mycena pura]